MSRPRIAETHLNPADVLALVAHFALNPRCPQCGGPVELKAGPGTAVDVHVEHRSGCSMADDT